MFLVQSRLQGGWGFPGGAALVSVWLGADGRNRLGFPSSRLAAGSESRGFSNVFVTAMSKSLRFA